MLFLEIFSHLPPLAHIHACCIALKSLVVIFADSFSPRRTKDPSILSSEGAIGKQFNPGGNIGQVGEKIGGPFSKVRTSKCVCMSTE